MSQRTTSVDKKIVRFAAQVADRIDSVVARLGALAERLPLDTADFAYFRDGTRELLTDGSGDDVLAGAGYAVAYLDQRCPPAMVWWAHRGDAVIERTHSVDPTSESFYDYASLRWFRAARESGRATLSGPFIDAWGADDYTVTVSVPVADSTGHYGVVAADVDLRRFISSMIADLRGIRFPLALVNEADRVVLSTSPRLSTGLPLTPRGTPSKNIEATQRIPVSHYGWSVIPLER